MNSLNRVQLLGHLGKDPEITNGANNFKVAKVSIATTSGYKDKATGEWKETTEWNNVAFYNQQAEYAEKFLYKGNKIFVEGKLATRSYDKQDGTKAYFTEVKVDSFINLTAKDKAPNVAQAQPVQEAAPQPNNDYSQMPTDDDMPF